MKRIISMIISLMLITSISIPVNALNDTETVNIKVAYQEGELIKAPCKYIDLLVLKKYVLGISQSQSNYDLDVNSDNIINVLDVVELKQIIINSY